MPDLKNKINHIKNRFFQKVTRLKEKTIGGGYDFAEPESIQIEPTIRCNLRCKTCDNEIKNRTSQKDLTFDNYKKILDQFSMLKEVNLTGYGEPLLNRDIFRIVEYTASKNIYTYFATNAMLLTDEYSNNLYESDIKHLIFSIDSPTAVEYNKIRKGADFDKVIYNIKEFIEIGRLKKKKVKTEIYTVGTIQILDKIDELLNLCSKLGISSLNIRGVFDHTGKHTSYYADALYHPQHRDLAEKILKEKKETAQKQNINLIYKPLRPVPFVCRMPSVRPYITVEGFITPCCAQGLDPRNVNFGNLLEEDIKNTWNNRQYTEFRRKLLSNDPPYICRFCPRLKGMA